MSVETIPQLFVTAVEQYDNASQLLVGRGTAGTLDLTWGASCNVDDTDYGVYAGRIDFPFDDHTPVVCSTGGSTSHTVALGIDDFYYLIVPNNGVLEGSYGDGNSISRSQGPGACFPQFVGACEE